MEARLQTTRKQSARTESNLTTLTPFEDRVADLLIEGFSNKEIAARLGLAEPTVKMHLRSIRRKLGARSRTHAAVLLACRACPLARDAGEPA